MVIKLHKTQTKEKIRQDFVKRHLENAAIEKKLGISSRRNLGNVRYASN